MKSINNASAIAGNSSTAGSSSRVGCESPPTLLTLEASKGGNVAGITEDHRYELLQRLPRWRITYIDLYLDDRGSLVEIAVNIPLSECYPDDPEGYALALGRLNLDGVHHEGGGAAPVHVLRPAGA